MEEIAHPTMDSNISMTALSKVFRTTELLELILHMLPTRDLLLSMRVSKIFKDTIEGSSRLQQALFFKPISERPVPVSSSSVNVANIVRNPLLAGLIERLRIRDGYSEWLPKPLLHVVVGMYHPSHSHEGASWRRMLLTQPPAKNLVYLKIFDKLPGMTAELIDRLRPKGKLYIGEIIADLDERVLAYDPEESDVAFETSKVYRACPMLKDDSQLDQIVRAWADQPIQSDEGSDESSSVGGECSE